MKKIIKQKTTTKKEQNQKNKSNNKNGGKNKSNNKESKKIKKSVKINKKPNKKLGRKSNKKEEQKNVEETFFDKKTERILSGLLYFLGPAVALFFVIILKGKKQDLLKYHSLMVVSLYSLMIILLTPLYFLAELFDLYKKEVFLILFGFYIIFLAVLILVFVFSWFYLMFAAFLGYKTKYPLLSYIVEKTIKKLEL